MGSVKTLSGATLVRGKITSSTPRGQFNQFGISKPKEPFIPLKETIMSRKASDVKHTIYGTKLAETAKACKFSITKIGEVVLAKEQVEWFPYSQIDKTFTDPQATGADWMIVSDWILKEKNLL